MSARAGRRGRLGPPPKAASHSGNIWNEREAEGTRQGVRNRHNLPGNLEDVYVPGGRRTGRGYSQLAGCSPNRRISWSCVNLTKASYCSAISKRRSFRMRQHGGGRQPASPADLPASFEVRISSYSSRTLSSRSFKSRSQIMPTCLKVNRGCSFLDGDEAPEDVPASRQKARLTLKRGEAPRAGQGGDGHAGTWQGGAVQDGGVRVGVQSEAAVCLREAALQVSPLLHALVLLLDVQQDLL